MSLPINFDLLSTKVPVDDLKSLDAKIYLDELNLAINAFNQFRHDPNFPNKGLCKNSLELDQVFQHDLPEICSVLEKINQDLKLSKLVYSELTDSSYFQEVWQIRPLNYLLVNILLLIYRTAVLHLNRDLLIDKSGERLVQISSALEEMAYYLHRQNKVSNIFPALKIWLDNWQEEGFDPRLFLNHH